MKLETVRKTSFPKVSFEEWKAKAEQSLKGKSVDSLQSNTYEGITLQPLYTKESVDVMDEAAGTFPFTRGIKSVPYAKESWLIAQKVHEEDPNKLNQLVKQALLRGQNCLSFSSEAFKDNLAEAFQQVFDGVNFESTPFLIDLKYEQVTFLSLLQSYCENVKVDRGKISGLAGRDPISDGLEKGKLVQNPNVFFKEWFKNIKQYQESFPKLRTILVKGSVVHNAGGSAVQELAMSLALAVEYLQAAIQNGMTPEEAAEKMYFQFSIDNQFFMNVAKLRAARRLWAIIGKVYEADTDSFQMHIHAETSIFTETLYDPYVNMLRAANQAFAAIVGGVQSLEVYPFDHATGSSTSFSERIARNTHLIIKEETWIDKVIDPAGGSYYVEKLTEELVEKAWALFLHIEEKGGAIEAIRHEFIQEEVEKTFAKRMENVAIRKESIIGTNVYPNPSDRYPKIKTHSSKEHFDFEPMDIKPLSPKRLSEEYETLRRLAEDYRLRHGAAPQVGLLLLKELKNHKARADFMKGFLAAGGIECKESDRILTKEDAVLFVKQTGLKHLVLCSDDTSYEEMAIDVVRAIKQTDSEAIVFIAGKQKPELQTRLQEEGIKDFIHVRSNVPAFIQTIFADLGGIK